MLFSLCIFQSFIYTYPLFFPFYSTLIFLFIHHIFYTNPSSSLFPYISKSSVNHHKESPNNRLISFFSQSTIFFLQSFSFHLPSFPLSNPNESHLFLTTYLIFFIFNSKNLSSTHIYLLWHNLTYIILFSTKQILFNFSSSMLYI